MNLIVRANININLTVSKDKFFSKVGQRHVRLFSIFYRAKSPYRFAIKRNHHLTVRRNCKKDPAIAIPFATYSCRYEGLEYANDKHLASSPRSSLGDQRHRGIPGSRRSSHFSIVTGCIHDPGCPGSPSSPFHPACLSRIPFLLLTFYATIDGRSLPPPSRRRKQVYSSITWQRALLHILISAGEIRDIRSVTETRSTER